MVVIRFHPLMKKHVDDLFKKQLLPSYRNNDDCFHIIDRKKVVLFEDPLCIKGYKRSENPPIKDNQFFEFISDDQLNNPPSWAIFFDFVKEIPHISIYEMKDKIIYWKPDYEELSRK